jgi:hypothetical protein
VIFQDQGSIGMRPQNLEATVNTVEENYFFKKTRVFPDSTF